MRNPSLVLITLLLLSGASAPASGHSDHQDTTRSGQGQDTRPLEATYQPTPEPGDFSDRYLFAMTRGVADSTLHPALQVPLFLVTVPVDIVLLPVAAIVGAF